MKTNCKVIGYILEQNGRILVDCKDESGKLCANCFCLPFTFVTLNIPDRNIVEAEIKNQFGDVSIVDFFAIFSTSFKTDSTSAMFYYVKLNKDIKIVDNMHKKWILPETILKESYGISCQVIDAFLKNKVQVLY